MLKKLRVSWGSGRQGRQDEAGETDSSDMMSEVCYKTFVNQDFVVLVSGSNSAVCVAMLLYNYCCVLEAFL